MEKVDTKESTEDKANTVAESLNVTGKYVALRDVNYHQISSHGYFIKTDSSSYQQYTVPKFTSRLIEQFKSNRVLIVTQPTYFDTASLLRYIGAQFVNTESVELLELDNSGEESASLLKEFPKQGTNKVFILDHIHPQSIDYDLSRLVQLATQFNSYFLISTEVSETVWQIKRNAFSDCWFRIPSEDLYSQGELEKDLLIKIEFEKERIGFLQEEEITPETNLSRKKKISDIVISFQRPEQINLFVYQLLGIEDKPEETQLQKKIDQATDDSAPAVVKWFHALPVAKKLIVIGACLLEGVYDDQFFQLMSEIVKENWKHRDSSLLALDYCDLEFLHHYFEFDEHGEGKRILRSKYPEQRISIIEAAWDSYRRHILYALPILVDAARNTIVSNEINWEKFGTQHRRMAIRQAVSGSVSDIGIHSLETVEHALLEFAAVSEVTLQRVTAKAMARWREYGEDQLLFDTLERWINSEEIRQTVEEFLKMEKIASINKSSANRALTYIRSTSVLTLGYAAVYDPPDELDQRLIDLMEMLIGDQEPQVRERLRYIIPRLVQQHTHRLLPLITEKLVKEDDLQELISQTLSKIYLEHPDLIKDILSVWLENCLEESSEDNRRQKFTHRDKVLVTALKTYQKLDFLAKGSSISITWLYDKLIIFSKKEQRSGVKEVIWDTLIHLLKIDYEEAEKQLPSLCPNPFSREADLLVRSFAKAYYEERLALRDQTVYRLELSDKEEELPVWMSPAKRPLTKVEVGMQFLLKSKILSNRQLATKVLWQFTKEIDKEELENLYLARSIAKESTTQKKEESSRPIAYSSRAELARNSIISLWIRFWIFICCIGENNAKHKRRELQAFYLVIRSKGLYVSYTRFLLLKWRQHPSPSIQKISKRLQFLIKRAW